MRVVLSWLVDHGRSIYRIGMVALVAAFPLLVLESVMGWPTWDALALGYSGGTVGLGGAILEMAREEI